MRTCFGDSPLLPFPPQKYHVTHITTPVKPHTQHNTPYCLENLQLADQLTCKYTNSTLRCEEMKHGGRLGALDVLMDQPSQIFLMLTKV